jgi:DNA-binding NarL/FixJ family response regulator
MNRPRPPAAIRVLLVDESITARQRLRRLLEDSGFVNVVGETQSCADALMLFAQHQPDAVVMDMNLADGAGCDLLREFKRLRPACTVIVLTGYVTTLFEATCYDLGADFFLKKPTDIDRIPRVIVQAVLKREPDGMSDGISP